ncbi:MAG: hypothetical protein PHW77_08790 [Eubacteriales bacterium]|nr:hypothetical protein [Eubacteriales bacterium]
MVAKLQKRLSLALAIIFLAFSFAVIPFTVSAGGEEISKDDAEIMVYEIIKAGIENLATEIGLSDYAQFNESEINDIISDVVKKNPQLFYFEGKGNTAVRNGKVVILSPTYMYTKSSIPSMKTAFKKYENAILAQSDKAWSDFEKALFVFEYLTREYIYNKDSVYDDAYNLMKNKTGSSLAYAKLAHCLFLKLGIEVEYANSGAYFFNAVKINGKWYYFDSAQGSEGVGCGMIHLNTFLMSAEKAKSIYSDIKCDVSCNSASYDTADWKDVYSGFAYAGGKWYYSKSEKNGSQYDCHIYSHDFSSGKSTVVNNITISNWKVWGEQSKVYTECFSGVIENNGYIYYNTPEAIFKYDPSSGGVTEVHRPSTTGGYIYGINIIADRLYCKTEKAYSVSTGFTSDIKLNEIYTIKFTDGNNTVKTHKLEYGKTIPESSAPVKDSYNTSDWDYFVSGMTVFGDAVFNTVYTNRYTYEFTDENGAVLKSVSGESGSFIIPPESSPEKAGTDTANYSFAYWDGYTECMKLTKNIKFKAVYEKTNKLKITFVYLNQKTVFYANPGDTLDSVPVPDPLTWTDEQYTYTYNGWENYTAGMTIDNDIIFTMKISKVPRQYTYKFINYDGKAFYTKTADYGTVITAPSSKPTYSDNSGYTYTFLEWDGFTQDEKLTQDRVFYALYKGVKNNEIALRKFNISLYRDDGVFLANESIYENQLLYLVSGEEMDYEDLQYYYDFQSWEGYEEGMVVTGNVKFTAIYKKISKVYKCTFYNNDETLIFESQGSYGSVIKLPAEPEIAAQYPEIYKFTGWIYIIGEEIKTLEEGMLLDGDYYFMATYEQAYTACTITFLDDDGTVLDTQVVDVLSIISGDLNQTYMLNDKEDDDYLYEFAEWSGFTVNMIITKDVTFTAVYDKTEKDNGSGNGRSRLPVPSEEESGLLEGKMLYIIIGGAALLLIIAVITVVCVSRKRNESDYADVPEDADETDK